MKPLSIEWVQKAEGDFKVAMEIRYPGASADLKGAEDAVVAVRKVRDACRIFLQI
jgi:hypothetical protein